MMGEDASDFMRRDGWTTYPTLMEVCLPLVNGGQEAVDVLLREAMAEQSGVSALRATGARPGKPDGRESIPLPLCP